MEKSNFSKEEKKSIRGWILEEFSEIGGVNLYCKWDKCWNKGGYYDLDFRIFIPMNKDFYNDLYSKKLYQSRNVERDFFLVDKIEVKGEFTFSFSDILDRLGCSFCRVEVMDNYSGYKEDDLKKGMVIWSRMYFLENKVLEIIRERKLKLLNI